VYLTLYWQKALDSLEYTQSQGGGSYDNFEKSISTQFNTNYFSSQCDSADPSNTWFFKLVDKVCPEDISSSSCGSQCGNDWQLCPSESSCDADPTSQKCPYALCRVEAIGWLISKVEPLFTFLLSSTYITAAMILLTCLLICYNPRDDVTEELIKTGLFVEKYDAGSKDKKKKGSSQQHLADHEEQPMVGGDHPHSQDEARPASRPSSLSQAQAKANRMNSPTRPPAAAGSTASAGDRRKSTTGPQRKNLLV
jgi:hypothetical protein